MVKKILFLLAFLSMILAGDSCTFSIDRLNNSVLKLDKTGQTCQNCFTTDVNMDIKSNSTQITSIELRSVTSAQSAKPVELTPLTKSLVINENFMIKYVTATGFTGAAFMTQCQTSQVNGKTVYDLKFKVQITGVQQIFTLNSVDFTSSQLLQNLSFAAIIIFMILAF